MMIAMQICMAYASEKKDIFRNTQKKQMSIANITSLAEASTRLEQRERRLSRMTTNARIHKRICDEKNCYYDAVGNEYNFNKVDNKIKMLNESITLLKIRKDELQEEKTKKAMNELVALSDMAESLRVVQLNRQRFNLPDPMKK